MRPARIDPELAFTSAIRAETSTARARITER
jgi:hypothetical protein